MAKKASDPCPEGAGQSRPWSVTVSTMLRHLTRADIGIAIGAGTDIAIDAADVVLMKSRLSDVPAAIRLSRATLRNIHENLFWAFFYNVIGIPLAAGVWIPHFRPGRSTRCLALQQ